MNRRILAVAAALGAALLLVVPAKAAVTGSICVKTNGGTVGLYPVGDINGQAYRLYDTYGGGILEDGDILSSHLAAWLYEQAQSGQIKASDIGGEVVFSDLQPGLYLIVQPSAPSEQKTFDPFLISIPWDGYMWEVTLNLEQLPQTGEHFVPTIWLFAMAVSAAGIGICLLQNHLKWKGRL